MPHISRTVVIPSAGIGQRLDRFTRDYNKAMCTLGAKPIISYILEKFTKEDEIIILTGYKGDLLKQVIRCCYPDWNNISFIDVDIFEGPGSGLGYSLSKAHDRLQKPFIFWSNDTVIEEDIAAFDYSENWLLCASMTGILNPENYRHADVHEGLVTKVLPKGEYDKSGYSTFPYVGVSFIKDFKDFGKVYQEDPELFIVAGESAGLNRLRRIHFYETKTWIDTGNKITLEKYKQIYNSKMEETILEKPNEAIWFIDNHVVKFHLDETFISDRIFRASQILNKKMSESRLSLPTILTHTKNVFVYHRAKGVVVSSVGNNSLFMDILQRFFTSVETENISSEQAYNIYLDFYKNKTLKRIKEYCLMFEDNDLPNNINGLECLSCAEIISSLDWKKLSEKGVFSKNSHGDFHLDNLLYDKASDTITMLDWRQNFGTKNYTGDIYYDFAKIWHGLIINHKMVKDNLFSVTQLTKNEVEIDINRTFIDTEREKLLIHFLKNSRFSLDHAWFLTVLIFLNIAACHIYPYSKFLFLLGKYLLNQLWNLRINERDLIK